MIYHDLRLKNQPDLNLEKDEIGINLIIFYDGAGTYIVTWNIIEDMAFRLSIENGN